MKLQRSTIILVSAALLLGAGVAISEAQRSRAPETTVAEGDRQPLFGFAEEDVVALTVERSGETLAFERQEATGTWQMRQPDDTTAEAGAIAFLLSRMNTDAPLQTVTLTPDQQAEFGFDQPQATVNLTLADGTQHRLLVGGTDFSGENLYVLPDPPAVPLPETAGELTAYVVAQDWANAVKRPLSEWKLVVNEGPEAPAAPTDAPANPTDPAAESAPAPDTPPPADETVDESNSPDPESSPPPEEEVKEADPETAE